MAQDHVQWKVLLVILLSCQFHYRKAPQSLSLVNGKELTVAATPRVRLFSCSETLNVTDTIYDAVAGDNFRLLLILSLLQAFRYQKFQIIKKYLHISVCWRGDCLFML